VPYHLREVADFRSFFQGLEVVEPGVVPIPEWRPEQDNRADVDGYCGVARKP
jgi:hypothetical protein